MTQREDAITKLRRVRCGGCGGKLGRTLNIMQLGLRATWEYPCAGNVITGEDHEAVALLCDACIDGTVAAKEAVELDGDTVRYHPVAELAPIVLTVEQARRKAALEREQTEELP